MMKIEILRIEECPNWRDAEIRVREALGVLKRTDAEFTVRLLTSGDEAASVPFAGSPTILLDGKDLFPSGTTTIDLACRVYRTDHGFAGAPSTQQIVDALAATECPAVAR